MITGSRVERKKYEKQQQTRSRRRKGSPKGSGGFNWKKLLKWLLIIAISLVFIGVLAGGALFAHYASNAPEVSELDLVGQVSSKVYDRNGKLIKELGAKNRDLMLEEEIPEVLEEAVLAIEDARFYDHHGIDPIRIGGALISNLKAGKIVEGGSTITQQLIKLSVFSTDFKDQTLERKSQEAWLALQLEREYTKKEILTLYLNKLYYSNNVYGAKTAARVFFNKDIQDINLPEAALLAGIPQAPSNYDPYINPEEAKERRDLVLYVMKDRKLITESQYNEAVAVRIEDMLVPLRHEEMNEQDLAIDAYIDLVTREVQENMNMNAYTDGLEIYTNLDLDLQLYLYNLVNKGEIEFPDDEMQTAVSIIDVKTGALQAVIGGRKQENQLGLNRAVANNRTIASTMKPLSVYGPAIEYSGYSTGTLVVDEPYSYTSGDTLENYDYQYLGKQTIREALEGSRNIPALKILQKVGLDNSYAFLQKLDINITNDNKPELVEANAIGGEVSPVQLSAAYAAIANYGEYRKPYTVQKIVSHSGTEQTFTQEPRVAMKPSTAYMLVDILKGVPGEFAQSAQIEGLYHGGKTGTSNYTLDQLENLGLDSSTYATPDGWYVGFTPQYSIATWVGYDNPNEPGNYLSLNDTRIPQVIYNKAMTYLMQRVPVTDWEKPENVVEVEIEKYTDPIMLPGPNTPSEARSVELFVKGSEPTEQSMAYGRRLDTPSGFDADYDGEKQAIVAIWDEVTEGNVELSLNGEIVYTGRETEFEMPVDKDGEYTIRLRLVDGNSSSDILVITLNITGLGDGEESTESSQTGDGTQTPVPDETQGEQTTTDPPTSPPAE